MTLFVDGALNRARAELLLEGLPQDVPEIFVDYLKRVFASPLSEVHGTMEEEFIRAATVVARVSLGTRMVPGDFAPENANSALNAIGLSAHFPPPLEVLISGGVVDRRTLGGMTILRFGLDPIAEHLAAIHSVGNLRRLQRAEVDLLINGLTNIEGYPSSCDGYLKAFATRYRAYSGPFGLPDIVFPWEARPRDLG